MSGCPHNSPYCAENGGDRTLSHCGPCQDDMDERARERAQTGECRICETALYGVVEEPGDDLCFACWARRDKAEAR